MSKKFLRSIVAASLILATTIAPSPLHASDHGDAPAVAGDQAADIADLYFFREKDVSSTESDHVVIVGTFRGFIVPAEALNFTVFDPTIKYRFQIENTEDEKPDAFIDVTFSEKLESASKEQTATVVISGAAGIKGKFTAKTAKATLDATIPANYFPTTAQKLKDAKSGADSQIEFFAGEVDDPFFFDIPGFVRFRDAVLRGEATAGNFLSRGRDSFAGYNLLTVAFKLPASLLKNAKSTNTTKFGANFLAQRRSERVVKGRVVGAGAFATLDRIGVPAVNVALVPFARKNEYNGGTTIDDKKGKFIGSIGATLTSLGTHPDNITALAGFLAEGDFLRLDTTVSTAFGASGRKPADDVIKTLLTIISNSNETQATLDDSVGANDVSFSTTFPYLGLPHLPLDTGSDDKTRN
ncbi:MAG: DUF4331 family protein [Verrucomicrobiota bacterium]